MKNIVTAAILTAFTFSSFAQRLSKVTIADKGNTVSFTYLLDENVILNIQPDGSIKEWGIDRYADRPDNYAQHKLDPFGGTTEYYTDNDNEAFRGKVKSIGKTQITYYTASENPLFAGKIKTLGPVNFTYYSNYDEASLQGKMKSIGQSQITYYASYENDGLKNKIKNIGSVGIAYYSSMEDKDIAGKVKSINGSPFSYYSSQDMPQKRGLLKSGNILQVINGVTYKVMVY